MVNRLDIRQDEYCDDIQRKNPEVQYVQLIDEEWYRILISENPFHRLKEAIACLTTGWASKYLPKNLVYDLMRNYSDGTTKVLEDQYSVLNQLQELTTKYLIETNEFDQIEP